MYQNPGAAPQQVLVSKNGLRQPIHKVTKSLKAILGGPNQIGVILKSMINHRCQAELLVPESHDPYTRSSASTNHYSNTCSHVGIQTTGVWA